MLIRRPWNGLFFVGFALISGLTLGYQQILLTKDDWRGVALYLEAHIENGDVVYANPAASSLALNLYWKNPYSYNGYPPNYDILHGGWAGQPLSPQIADEELTNSTQGFKRVWLVEFYPKFWDENQYIPAWLASHGNLSDDKSFNNIHLRLYELIP